MTLHEELKRTGINSGEWIVEYPVPHSIRDFYAGALEFARRWKAASEAERPTAMICLNDEVAMTAISALASEGISVPQQISLVGCDNIPESEYVVPALTTIDNHPEQQMAKAVDLLLNRITNRRAKRVCQVISPTLVIRDSVRSVNR